MSNTPFPVIICNEIDQIPENTNICYFMTNEGTFLYKNLATIESLTKVDSISFLKKMKRFAKLKIPTIPKDVLATAIVFLKYVFRQCQAEGGLIIHYYPDLSIYTLHCPVQEVSSGGVNWDNKKEPIPRGAIRIGSIHSHADGSAFHSYTDQDDEKSFDGIHITVGRINDKYPTIVASVVVNANRFKLDESEILRYLDLKIIPEEDPRLEQYRFSDYRYRGGYGYGGYKGYYGHSPCYEDYVSQYKDKHNSSDITNDKNDKSAKSGKPHKFEYESDERRFELDISLSDIRFPDDWKSKFTRKYAKYYVWDPAKGKLVPKDYTPRSWDRYDKYSEGEWSKSQYPKSNYDYSKYDDTPSTYPPSPSIPFDQLETKNDPLLLPAPDESYYSNNNGNDKCMLEEDEIYPLPDGCVNERCIYRRISIDALESGQYEDIDYYFDDDDYFNDDYPIGMDEYPTDDYMCGEYYGDKHTETDEDIHKYDIKPDDQGNLVDCDGNPIDVVKMGLAIDVVQDNIKKMNQLIEGEDF